MPIGNKNYDRSVTLICGSCAGDQFEDENPEGGAERIIVCKSCDKEATFSEIKDANSAQIEFEVEAIGEELVTDLKKGLKGFFK